MVAEAERADWARDIAEGLGYQPTPWRIDFFTEWMRWENTVAENNPLATTWKSGLEDADWTPFNHNGGNPVCNYASEEIGLSCTVKTLSLSYYDAIRQALTEQKLGYAGSRERIAQAVRTWGTMGFANRVANGWSPGGARQAQSLPPEQPQAVTAAPKRPHAARTARKAVRDTAATTPAIGALLIGAVTATDNWGEIGTQLSNGHWATAIGLFVATPLALALWRVVRGMLGQEPTDG